MNWIDYLYAQISVYISIPYLLIFMFLSYMVKKHFNHLLEKITRFEWKTVYTVLFIATLTAVPFLFWSDEGWMKIAVSYSVGTSLYELVFEFLEKKR